MKVSDRKYLDFLQTQPCIICGLPGNEWETVEPAHVGTYARGAKTDDEALPLLHRYHAEAHQHGEMTMFRKHLPDYVLREALRAYARHLYAEWKAGQ